MPKFVPVADPELARNEQNFTSAENMKHKKFDNPHAVLKPKDKVDRGWQQGSLGWGVLGSFGSDEKDDAAQVIRRGEGSAKMVKNEKGLWVKAKDLSNNEGNTTSASSSSSSSIKSKGAGRGGGISVFESDNSLSLGSIRQMNDKTNNDKNEYASHHRKFDDADPDDYSGSRKQSKTSTEIIDIHDRRSDRDRDSRKDSRDRERHRDLRSDSRDRDRHRASRSDSRDRHSDSNRDSHRIREDYVVGKSGKRFDIHDDKKATKAGSRSENKDKCYAHDDQEKEEEDFSADNTDADFSLNAIQIVNHFLELFNDCHSSALQRVDHIAELFHPDAVIASLKSDKQLLVGREAIRQSFMKTAPSEAQCSYRLFIPPLLASSLSTSTSSTSNNNSSSSNNNNTNNSNNTNNPNNTTSYTSSQSTPSIVSFTLDLHPPESSPGLGDRMKNTVLLYRCEFNTNNDGNGSSASGDSSNNNASSSVKNKSDDANNSSKNNTTIPSAYITHVWGAVDPQNLASKESLTEIELFQSTVWKWTLQILKTQLPAFDYTSKTYFHDYTNIETI